MSGFLKSNKSGGVFTPRSEKVEINTESGSVTYQIKELLASERNMLLFHTTKMLGESAGTLIIRSVGDNKDLSKNDYSLLFGFIINGLRKNSTPEELNDFIQETVKTCVVTPKDATESFDLHFCQYYDHQWPLISAIYEFNFGGTISVLKKKLEALEPTIPKSGDQYQKENKPEIKQESRKSAKRTPSTNF